MGQITRLRNNVQHNVCLFLEKFHTYNVVLRPLTKAAGLLPSLLSPTKKIE